GASFTGVHQQLGQQLARLSKAQLTEFIGGIKLVELKKLAHVVLPNGEHLDSGSVHMAARGTRRDCAIIKVKTANAPVLPVGDSARSQVEDHIVVLGYPGV